MPENACIVPGVICVGFLPSDGVFFLFHSEFLRALLTFPKPVVAAVNGQAVGFGVGILPLCDIVYASDKAMFYTPYTQLGQVPEAGLSCTLSRIIGDALVSHSKNPVYKMTDINGSNFASFKHRNSFTPIE